MIQEGLRVTIPLKDKALGVVALEVQLVLQSPGIFSAHQFHAACGKATGYLFRDLPIVPFVFSYVLTGEFQAYSGSGGVAGRSVFGWSATRTWRIVIPVPIPKPGPEPQ
jgi:hypothetical protein